MIFKLNEEIFGKLFNFNIKYLGSTKSLKQMPKTFQGSSSTPTADSPSPHIVDGPLMGAHTRLAA